MGVCCEHNSSYTFETLCMFSSWYEDGACGLHIIVASIFVSFHPLYIDCVSTSHTILYQYFAHCWSWLKLMLHLCPHPPTTTTTTTTTWGQVRHRSPRNSSPWTCASIYLEGWYSIHRRGIWFSLKRENVHRKTDTLPLVCYMMSMECWYVCSKNDDTISVPGCWVCGRRFSFHDSF